MAIETTILPVIEKLRELQHSKRITDSILGSRVKKSIGILKEVHESLRDQETNDSGMIQLLQTVYRAEDTIDAFVKEISKEFYQQKLLVKAFPAGIHFRSVYIQTRFGDKMGKLLGDVEFKSRKMLEAAARESTAGNDDCDKKINLKDEMMLDLKGEIKELAELILAGYSSPLQVSVVDVAGSAKTTDLSKMYACEAIKNYFECRAWLEIPEELEKRELVEDILKQVAGSEVEENSPSLQQKLRNSLIQKRYLVVLNNVRTPEIWEILQFVFPNSSNGSRVILSFREADAARYRNLKFFGRNLLLNPKTIRVASDIREGDVDDDVDPNPEPVSDEEILKEEIEIVGMKDQILDLARLTLNGGKRYFIISLMGLSGSGKTTLVKTIYNSSYTRRNFDCRAWVNVYVSHDFDMRKVLSDMLEQITEVNVEEELAINDLESKLHECLNQKRYLIVLDDVHLPGAWNQLKWIFSPISLSNGSRVILITREARIARSFTPSFVHQLRLLDEGESLQLFLKKVGRVESSPEILGEIWKISGGLPLAISVLGGLLSPLPDSEWSDVIKQIMLGRDKKKKELAASDESISPDELASWDTSSIWGLGYKFLSPHLRACLHYLCFFPRSMINDIPVRRLLQLWLAERLVAPTEAENIALEDRVKKGFEQLKNRNMIEIVKEKLDGSPKTCRVPSSLYDILSPNAKRMGFFHIHYDGSRSESAYNSEEFCVRRLAEHLDNRNETIPSDKYIKYLHSYVSFDNRVGDKPAEEVGDFLNKTITKRGYGLLRVLDLEGVYKPKLPKTIGKLQLLRYVGLRWTFLDTVPDSVGDLPCLETLDVKHTNITTLPMSIWKAKTLRHLYMNDIHFKMSIQTPFLKYSLSNLQTLWGLLIGNTSPSLNWLESLSGLRKLGLTCHTASLGKITKWIEGLESLESLRLRSINDFGEPSDLNFLSVGKHEKMTELYLLGKLPGPLHISKLPSKLKILTLSLSHLSEDPMPVLEQLKELNTLRLFAHSYMGEEMTCHPGGFPKLRVLKVWVLKELKDWNIEEGAMPSLRELELRNCRKLKKPNGLEKVATLKELKLTNMENNFTAEVRESMPRSVNIDPPLDKRTPRVSASG